jgi:serine/threonine protein kinase
MVPSDPFKLVGTIVDGRYRVERVAGRGGHGVVYRAFHISFESTIALKVLKLPDDLPFDKSTPQRIAFQREGKVLFELSSLHPSIVKAFETGVVALADGSVAPYLALEWLDGVSLDHEIKHRRKNGLASMSLPEVLTLLNGPAEGLMLAHARGIVHRDLKPGNLFVARGRDGPVVKILDFGIAKMIGDSMSTTTKLAQTGPASSFTPMYAAPEQWLRRLGATGTWTDVHGWALVCVELLTGSVPLNGEEAAQFMAASLDPIERPTPARFGLQLPAEVEAVFGRGLALRPRDRFRDIGEFWRALGQAAGWSPDRAGSMSFLSSLDAPDESSSSIDHGSPEPRLGTTGFHTTRPTASRSLARVPRPPWRPSLRLALAMGVLLGSLVVIVFVRARGTSDSLASAVFSASPAEQSHHVDHPTLASPAKESARARDEDLSVRDGVATAFSSIATEPVRPSSEASPPSPRVNSRSRPGPLDRRSEHDGGNALSSIAADPPPTARESPRRTDAGAKLDQLLDNEELLHRR